MGEHRLAVRSNMLTEKDTIPEYPVVELPKVCFFSRRSQVSTNLVMKAGSSSWDAPVGNSSILSKCISIHNRDPKEGCLCEGVSAT